MKNYENVLMDWDGNLVKTLDVWLEACREVLQSHGHELSDLEIGESFGSFPHLLRSIGVEEAEEGMIRAASIAVRKLHTVELYPGATNLLDYLKYIEKPVALITSSDEDQVTGLLERHDLAVYFETIVTGEMTEYRKPHPEPLLLAMSRIGAIAASTIIVGDSDKDIVAASKVGVDSVLFFPPEHQRFYRLEDLARLSPTYIVESLDDVKEIIK
jgi:phosphoglycolate phosphatase